jgi:hypothetical protein
MTEKILSIHIDQRKNMFLGAMTLIGMCMCMYIYMVTTTIRNIVAEKNISSQISDMSQKISSKEFALIGLESGVTLEYAQSLGFADAKSKVFITPSSVSYVSSNPSNNPAI